MATGVRRHSRAVRTKASFNIHGQHVAALVEPVVEVPDVPPRMARFACLNHILLPQHLLEAIDVHVVLLDRPHLVRAEHLDSYAAQVFVEELLLLHAQVHELGKPRGESKATHDNAQLAPEPQREQDVVACCDLDVASSLAGRSNQAPWLWRQLAFHGQGKSSGD